MFQKDKWPFIPVCLSEIIDEDTLAVIESGCCERLGRPLTILDRQSQTGGFSHRIESINLKQRFENFCKLLRDEKRVRGGDEACRKCNIEQAKLSLQEFRRTDDPFRTFACHVGLQEVTYIIRIRDQPLALLYSGQYCPPKGIDEIRENVRALGTGRYARVYLDDTTRRKLLSLAKNLPPAPADLRDRLRREAEHIQRIAEAEYQQGKYQWEQNFLDTLRVPAGHGETTSLERLQQSVRGLLERIRTFCRCECVVFFASVQEGDTVLAPIAWAGIPMAIEGNLPHFNWKKAELSVENFDARTWDIAKGLHRARTKGIRGDNSEYFVRASCVLPTSLGNRYRSVLVLGPFAEPVNLQEERRLLVEITNTIGSFALTELEVRYLEQERRRWKSTATLLTHQMRTALTPITTQIGRAKLLAQEISKDTTTTRVVDLLKRAEDLGLRLAKSARQTLAGHIVQLEREDLEFERYSLSVLVVNCAEGFVPEAKKRHRDLVVDKSVERLPEAEVDVARLTIALSNLIENAIKYSYPNTTIYIRADLHSVTDLALAAAVIEVDDIGDEIQPEAKGRIFEEGTRGLTKAKMGRISGSGLGLWEARSVIDAHGGEIGVLCKPTLIQRRQGTAYRVVFSVKVPLSQNDVRGRS